MNCCGLHLVARVLSSVLLIAALLAVGPAMADEEAVEASKSSAVEGKTGEEQPAEKKPAEKKPVEEPKEKADEKSPSKDAAKPAAKEPVEEPKEKADEKSPSKDAAKPAEKEGAAASAKKAEAASAEKAKPETVKVKRSPLVIKVELSGVFEAHKTAEIALQPKQWSELKVLGAVEHGATVRRGEPLVTLDFEKIDQQIADLRTQLRLKDLGVALAEQQLEALETIMPMDLAAAERSNRETQDDLAYYLKTQRPLSLKSADMMLKMSAFQAEYSAEELRQLEKMYKADELTEETEEIILKRAKFQAEMSRFSHELQKIDHARMLKTDLPRRDERVKEAAKRAELAWERIRVSLPDALKQQRITLEQTRVEHERAKQKLEELRADRESMRVTAPIDGVVYYGQATRGKFGSADTVADDLKRGGSLSANKVFMTVVQPSPVSVRATVPEKELEYVEVGLKGTVEPTAYPDLRLTGIVRSVSAVPISSGSFEAQVTVAKNDDAAVLMPGMACKVKCLGYAKRDALTLPPKAVGTDPLDDAKQFVMAVGKDGKQQKRPVTVGKKTGDAVEILKGIKEGAEVLAEFPEGK